MTEVSAPTFHESTVNKVQPHLINPIDKDDLPTDSTQTSKESAKKPEKSHQQLLVELQEQSKVTTIQPENSIDEISTSNDSTDDNPKYIRDFHKQREEKTKRKRKSIFQKLLNISLSPFKILRLSFKMFQKKQKTNDENSTLTDDQTSPPLAA